MAAALVSSGAISTNPQGGSSGTLNVAGGTLTAPVIINKDTVNYSGGSITASINNSANVNVSGGAARTLTGDFANNAGGTLTVAAATPLTVSGVLTQAASGASIVAGANITVGKDYNNLGSGTGNSFDRRANVSGAGQILGNNAAQTITGNVAAAGTNTWTLNLGNVRGGSGPVTQNYQIANNGTGADIRGAIQTTGLGNVTDSRLSGTGVTAGNFGPIVAGGNSGNLSVTLTGPGAALAGQKVAIVSNFDNVSTQVINITGGAVSALAVGNATPTAVNLGNFRLGTAGADANFNVQNQTTGAGAEQLGINSALASSGFSANNAFGAGLIGPGASASGAVTAKASGSGTAGVNTGTVTINYATDGTNIDASFNRIAANSQVINVQATGYNVAQGSANPSPINLGNFRVGQAGGAAPQSQDIAITNTVAGPFTESLGVASAGVNNAAFTLTNNIGGNLVVAGGTNNTALSVARTGGSAGVNTGTVAIQYTSDGAGTSGLAAINSNAQNVTVNATGYNVAVGNATPDPVQVANQRVGGSATATLTVANTAAAGAFSEDLNASFSGSTGAATSSGSISGRLAGTSNTGTGAMTVGVNTSVAGAQTGTVTLNYQTAGAVNGVSNGLGTAGAGSQVVTVNGNVYQAAVGQLNTAPLNFGVVQVGQSVSQVLSISNIATGAGGFVEDLNARFGATNGTGGNLISGSGQVAGLLAGATNSSAMTVNVNTSAAGSVNGGIAVDFFTAGAVNGASNGLGEAGVGSANFGVSGTIETTGTVVNQASPQINTPTVALGNVRVGDTSPTGVVSVTNVATVAPQAALNASISTSVPLTASGSFSLLAPGATDNTSLTVGMQTGTAGSRNGTATIALVSDASNIAGPGACAPNCQLTLASQNVSVTGGVYQVAQPNLPASVSLGNVHVGGALSQAITIGNTLNAPIGFQEGLNVAVGGTTGGATGSGAITNLAAGGSSNAVTIGLAGIGAGNQSGTVTLNLASNGTGTSGLATLGLPSAGVTVNAVGYDLASAAVITPNPVVLGNQRVGGTLTQALTIANTAPAGAFTETLAANFGASTGNATSNLGTVSGIAGGSSDVSALQVGVNTSTAGARSGTVVVNLVSNEVAGSGLGNTALSPQTINVSGNVYNVAVGSATPTPVVLANQRVGGSLTQGLTVANTAATGGFSEALNASFGSNGGQAINNGGAVSNLIAGGSSGAMSVGVSTTTAGAKTGTVTLNYQTDGTGPNGNSGLAAISAGSQTINVSGNVYNVAVGNATPSPVQVANQRIGGSTTATLTVANTAAAGAFSEDLSASFGASTGAATGSGSISGRLAGTSNTGTGAMTVGVNTSVAGAQTGTVTLNYQTAGAVNGVSNGLGTAGAGSQVVTVNGNVYQAAVGQLEYRAAQFRRGAGWPVGVAGAEHQQHRDRRRWLRRGPERAFRRHQWHGRQPDQRQRPGRGPAGGGDQQQCDDGQRQHQCRGQCQRGHCGGLLYRRHGERRQQRAGRSGSRLGQLRCERHDRDCRYGGQPGVAADQHADRGAGQRARGRHVADRRCERDQCGDGGAAGGAQREHQHQRAADGEWLVLPAGAGCNRQHEPDGWHADRHGRFAQRHGDDRAGVRCQQHCGTRRVRAELPADARLAERQRHRRRLQRGSRQRNSDTDSAERACR